MEVGSTSLSSASANTSAQVTVAKKAGDQLEAVTSILLQGVEQGSTVSPEATGKGGRLNVAA